MLFVCLCVGDVGKLGGRGVLFGVGGVDAIHTGALEQQVGFDFHRTERCTSIGSEERIARTPAMPWH